MKVKNAMAILAVLLIFGAVLVNSCSAQSSRDYLKIRGNIVNDHNADITVYSQDFETDAWTMVATKKISTKYRLRLATDVDYKIVFVSDEGSTKTVHITAGDPGIYLEYVDIDFYGSNERHACMYQNNTERYVFQTKNEHNSTASIE
jgi:outer membrane lipoprotein-sorting protein